MALAEARLSQDDRLELLDRSSIQRILAEQKLSLSGLVDAEQAVAVGKLLGVQAFAVLESLGDQGPPSLVIFDAYSGARLIDVDLPPQDVQAQVEAVENAVQRAREKLAALGGGMHARTICVLAVRNADLPRRMDGFCDGVAMLMQRRLLASNDICLLERKRLEAINRERQLPTAAPATAILASVVCTELEFSHPISGAGVTVTALLTNAQGKLLAKPSLTMEKEDVMRLANDLSAKVADALQVVPGALEVNANDEARRFRREATFLLAHRQVEQGVHAAQAAYALNPGDAEYAALAAFALLRHAAELSSAGGRDVEALETATRAIEIRDSRLVNLREKNPHDPQLRMAPDNLTGDWMTSILRRAYEPPFRDDPAVAVAAKELGGAYLQFINDWLAFSEAASAGDARLLSWHMEYVRLNDVVTVISLASPDVSQYLREVSGLYSRFFDLADQLDRRSGLPVSMWAAHELGDTNYRGVPERSWQKLPLQSSDLQQFDRLFSKLEQSDEPAIRFYGLRDRLLFDKNVLQASSTDCQPIYEKARQAARDAMDDPDLLASDGRGLFRNHLYTDAMNLLVAMRLPSQSTLAERLDWYDFMFSRHEIPLGAVINLNWLGRGAATGSETSAFLKRLVAAADSPQAHFLGCSPEEGRVKLAEQVRKLSDAVPEIRAAVQNSGRARSRVLLQTGGDTGIDTIKQVVRGDGVAFVIASVRNGRERRLQALRVPLDGSKPQTLGSIPGNPSVNDACIDGQRLFVATERGIEIYPLRGGAVSTLTQDDGLPTNAVQSLAVLGDVIYAGLEDNGYLIAYDMKSRSCRVLASSRRKQHLSPFDDTISFAIPRIAVDPFHRRLLLVQHVPGRRPQNGLWAFDPGSGQFTQLLALNYDYGSRCGASRMLPDGRLLLFSYNWALVFDARRDTSQVLFASGDVGPGIVRDSGALRFNHQIGSPYSLVRSELWAGKPLCRIEAPNGGVQPVALSSTSTGGDVSWIEPLPGGEHVLVGNAQGLWLVSRPFARAISLPSAALENTKRQGS